MKIVSKEELRKEYYELKDKRFSIDEAIDYLMSKLETDYLITQFNGVYVYMGTYKLVKAKKYSGSQLIDVLVEESDENATFRVFYELDTGLRRCVDIGIETSTFERNNTIIYIPNVRNFESEFTFSKDFKKLRKLYFKEFFLNGEETALSLITSEDYIKQVFSIENYMKENNIRPFFYQALSDAALCNKKTNSKPIVKTFKKEKTNAFE